MFQWEQGGLTSSPIPRSIRRRRVLAAGTILAIAGLLLAGLGLFPQEPLRRWAEARLKSAAGEGSALGGLHVVPFLLSVELRDLRLEGPGYSLVASRARLVLAPRALSGALALRRLEMDAPTVELTAAAGEDAPVEAPGAIPSLEVDSIAIRDLRVRWRGLEEGSLSLDGIAVEGAVGSGPLAVEVPRGMWRGERTLGLGPARAGLSVSRDLDVVLDSFEARLGVSVLRARGALARRGEAALALDLDADLDLADGGLALGRPELAGRLEANGRLQGTLEQLVASLDAEGEAAWGPWALHDLSLGLKARPREGVLAGRFEGRALGGRLDGEVQLEGSHWRGRLRGADLDLAHLPPEFAPPASIAGVGAEVDWEGPLDGPLEVRLTARGRGRHAAGRARAEARARGSVGQHDIDLTWMATLQGETTGADAVAMDVAGHGRTRGAWPPEVTGEISGAVNAVGGLSSDQMSLAGMFRVQGDGLHARLEGEGPFSLAAALESQGPRIEGFSVTVGGLDLARLGVEATGVASLELEAAGPWREPAFSLRASAADLAWAGTSLGRAEAAAEGTPERAELRAALPDLSLGAAAEIRARGEEGPWLEGQAELHDAPLALLGALAGLEAPLVGSVTATLGFGVPVSRPAEATVEIDVGDLAVVYEGRPLRVRPFRGQLAAGRLAFRDVRVEGEGVSLDISASGGLGDDAPLELRAWLDADLGILPLPEGWSLAGSLGGAMAVSGTRARPSLEGALHAEDLALAGPSGPDLAVADLELHLGERALAVPAFEARIGEGGQATLQGEIPYAAVWPGLREGALAPADRARLSATWKNLTVAAFDGGLDGELTLEGGLSSLEELHGEMRLPARQLAFEGMSLEVQPATLRLEGGRVTADALTVRSTRGDLLVTGVADLLDETLNVRARGGFALGLLSPLLKEASIGGNAEVDLVLSGPLTAPVPRGSVAVDGVSIRMRALPQAVTGIGGRVDLEGTTATLVANGDLGGGSLHLEGEAVTEGAGLSDLWLQLTGRDVALRYPPGLRSRLDVDLTLAGQPGDMNLAGSVGVRGGVYELDSAVRQALRAPASASAAESDILRDVALDVTVDLVRPVAVESGFGRLEATGRINARGDLQEPAPFGRLDVRRGGRIELQGRELTVTGGTLAYSGTWNAELSLNGETVVPNVEFGDRSQRDIRVRASLTGSIEQPSLGLSSDPPLSRQEIVSAIATGRLQSSLVDSSAWLLGGQAATLVSGQLTRRVAQTFGLDEITVRPDLVARDTDPSARFTFGKRIGRPLALVYSAGLGGPETRFAEMRAYPGLNVQLRAQRRDTGTYELGLGQRFEFGGAAPDESAAEAGERLQEVRFEGVPLDEDLRRSVRLSRGRPVADWRLQREADRLRTRLRRRGHLDAEVSARLEGSAAVFAVEPGPVYGWRVEGMVDPPDLGPIFESALFEADAADLGRTRLLGVLERRGHLRADVEASAQEEGDRREIVFEVEPGPRFDPVTVRFPGARTLSRRELLAAAGGASGLLASPEAAVAGIQEAYRAHHHLAARVEEPRVERAGSGVAFTVRIEEGPPAHLAWLRAEGVSLPGPDLDEVLSTPTGVPFSTEMVTEAVARVRGAYLARGYTDVRIRPELVAEGSDLGILLRVRAGDPRTIRSIALSGNTRTRDWLVRRALDLEEGQPLDPRRLGRAERRLLQLGTFSRSAIVPHPEEPGALEVDLREAANLTLAYDARWDDEAGWSGLVDGLAGNLGGLGVGLGGRVRYGSQLRELRGSLHLPAALTAGDVTASIFRTDEDIPADDFDIVRRQTGFQVQHSMGRPSRLELLLGYRFRRNLTLAPVLPEIPIDVGGLDVSLLRTTLDDLLDPRRGAFWSLNLNLAPTWLGSDAPLLKGYAQTTLTRSFRENTLTWAQSFRLGLAWGLDGEPVIASERFRAGGASSLRGFGTNEVGPRGFFGEATGGAAVAIMNQEIRYHHRTGLGLVGFYDVGNVFPTVGSMRFDLRHTLGAGVRWASPVGLLRLDVGFPVDREPEEKSYRLFFGLGQAF